MGIQIMGQFSTIKSFFLIECPLLKCNEKMVRSHLKYYAQFWSVYKEGCYTCNTFEFPVQIDNQRF